jgi:hypothetical protein
MITCTEEARADLPQIAPEVGQERIGHSKAFRPLAFGVLGEQEDINAGGIELDMSADGEKSDGTPPRVQKDKQRQDEAVPVLKLALLMAALWQV